MDGVRTRWSHSRELFAVAWLAPCEITGSGDRSWWTSRTTRSLINRGSPTPRFARAGGARRRGRYVLPVAMHRRSMYQHVLHSRERAGPRRRIRRRQRASPCTNLRRVSWFWPDGWLFDSYGYKYYADPPQDLRAGNSGAADAIVLTRRASATRAVVTRRRWWWRPAGGGSAGADSARWPRSPRSTTS